VKVSDHSAGFGIALIILAILLFSVGGVVWAIEKGHLSPTRWKLPGDIHLTRGPVYIWIPLGLSLLLSVLATLLLNLFRR
jgi:hypothetical protein